MARGFLTAINLNKNEIQNAVVQNLASAPGSPVKGLIYFDTTLNQFGYYNGTSWIYGTTTPDATTTTKGIVQLAGDLTGTAASPAIAALAVTAAKIANATITDVQVAAANKDGVAGTASMRTLGTGAQQAASGADSRFADALALGLKQSVKATTTANITLSGPQTVDSVSVVAGDRVLVKNQTTVSENGIYVVQAGAWTRATDADTTAKMPPGVMVMVQNSNVGATFQNALMFANGVFSTGQTWSPFIFGPGTSGTTIQIGPLGINLGPNLGVATGTNKSVNASADEVGGTRYFSNSGPAGVYHRFDIAGAVTFKISSAGMDFNSLKGINLLDPTAAQDAATKNYVDSVAQGVQWKAPVRAIATTNITLSAPQTIDGVSLVAGDRVLVAGQTTASANGIYIVAAGAWTRATDADVAAEIVNATVMVSEGTLNADTLWTQTANAPITLGTTNLAFVNIQSATNLTADNVLIKKASNVLSAVTVPDPTAGANGSFAFANSTGTNGYGAARSKYGFIVGDGSTTSFSLGSNPMGTAWVDVTVYDNATNQRIETDVTVTVSNITIGFGVAPAAAAQYRVVLIA